MNKEGHSIFTYDGEIGAWTQLRYGDTVNLLDGIWIYSADSRYVSLMYSSVTSPSPSGKPLYTGWNSIGFASAQPVAAREALSSLLDHWDQVIGYDSSLQFYEVSIVRNGSGSHSDANPVYPFRGYWIRMTGNSTLST
ncbi:MAG: hypothetical protein A4E42_01763 [Methanoregulaceae archaeon PtaU1.Bin222]|nr:MAG: hypothetical protein A4E42_01763 [Methanoregulaceae archaeon PtaU1.Bin222]